MADAFDAMTSVRPYRPSLSVADALTELERMKRVQFDPMAVDAFTAAFPDASKLPIATPEVQALKLPARAVAARRA